METIAPNPQNPWAALDSFDLVRELIRRIGDDPSREGVIDTPRRVVKSWTDLFAGYRMSADQVLGTTFRSDDYDQMVICKDIEMYSTCEHHLIPFFGKVHIGYIPQGRVVGLSKLARVVEVFARRLQIQEQMTHQIAESINRVLSPKGVIVVVEAKHLCMCARGIQKQHSSMVTSAIKGVLSNQNCRAEFMELIGR